METMERQGRRLIVAALVGMALLGPLGAALGDLAQRPWLARYAPYLAALWAALPLLLCGVALWRRYRAGPTFLTVARGRIGGATALLAGACLLDASVLLAHHEPSPALFQCGLGAAVLLGARSGAQLRERGLTVGLRYIPWERITSYAVRDEFEVSGNLAVTTHAEVDLTVRPRAWLRSRGSRGLTVSAPPSEVGEIAQALARRIPSEGRRRHPLARTTPHGGN